MHVEIRALPADRLARVRHAGPCDSTFTVDAHAGTFGCRPRVPVVPA